MYYMCCLSVCLSVCVSSKPITPPKYTRCWSQRPARSQQRQQQQQQINDVTMVWEQRIRDRRVTYEYHIYARHDTKTHSGYSVYHNISILYTFLGEDKKTHTYTQHNRRWWWWLVINEYSVVRTRWNRTDTFTRFMDINICVQVAPATTSACTKRIY